MDYIVVTGASNGIGNAIAKQFAHRDKCGIALTYNRDYDGVKSVCEELTSLDFFVLPVKMDLSKDKEVANTFDYIYKCFPRIDALINNAGISLVKPFYQTTSHDWDRIIDVDLNGAFRTTKQVIDKMNSEGGVIFNVASVWGETGASCEVAYSTAKAGIIGMSKALNKEYDNVSVKAISVGFANTRMNSHMTERDVENFLRENPKIKLRSAEYVAKKMLKYLDRELEKIRNNEPKSDKDNVVLRIW